MLHTPIELSTPSIRLPDWQGDDARNAKSGSGKSESHNPNSEMGPGKVGYEASTLLIPFFSILRRTHSGNEDKREDGFFESQDASLFLLGGAENIAGHLWPV